MPGPPVAVAAVRHAVRAPLAEAVAAGRAVLLAVSGGPDSVAMAAAVAFEAASLARRGGSPRVAAAVVDHGLQPGSGGVAEEAARVCQRLGIDEVGVHRVQVREAGDGPEAAARAARHAALETRRAELAADLPGGAELWLAHTRDDQAEQVLLGLLRGAGTRSLAAMAPRRGPLVRPLLDLPGATTRQACADLGLPVHHDPHNEDPRFTRVRVRRALDLLAAETGEDLGPALARTAAHARADADLLDALAAERRAGLAVAPDGSVEVAALAGLEEALRPRVWRALVREAAGPGVPDPTSVHLAQLDRLLTAWHGQGAVDVPGPWRWGRWRTVGGDAVVGPIGKNGPAPGDAARHGRPA